MSDKENKRVKGSESRQNSRGSMEVWGERNKRMVMEMFNKIWEGERWAKSWKIGKIVLLVKKEKG